MRDLNPYGTPHQQDHHAKKDPCQDPAKIIPLFLTMKWIAILKATCNKLLMFLTRIERVSDGPEPSGLSIILQEQMGMTGCRKPMLRIAAYHGLNPRCIDVLLHTRMSHAGRWTSGVARRPGSLDVRGRTRSGGPRFCDDRSGAETVRSATTVAETVRLARTGVERRL